MIIRHNNLKPLKNIPYKYKQLQNITDYLEDETTTRLTDDERLELDRALFTQAAFSFLKHQEHIPANLYEGTKPDYCSIVEVRGGENYYALHLSNGIAIKCTYRIYSLALVKVRHYRLPSLEDDSVSRKSKRMKSGSIKGQLQLF